MIYQFPRVSFLAARSETDKQEGSHHRRRQRYPPGDCGFGTTKRASQIVGRREGRRRQVNAAGQARGDFLKQPTWVSYAALATYFSPLGILVVVFRWSKRRQISPEVGQHELVTDAARVTCGFWRYSRLARTRGAPQSRAKDPASPGVQLPWLRRDGRRRSPNSPTQILKM